LIGVWGPREWDLSLSALSTYTKVEPPPPNPWLDQNKPRMPTPDPTKAQSGEPSATASAPTPAAAPTPKPRKRLPSRRLIRHVLRARLNASQALATFLAEVERSGQNVRASLHLAKQFDGPYNTEPSEPQDGELGFLIPDGPQAWRGSKEVITFLRSQRARIAALQEEEEGDWAAGQLSSGDEGVEDTSGVMGELEWVAPNTQ
jgi:glycerol-3-phosphate O-acyltransferase / dihydroxyacetone phosphate acyltransferase